MTMPSTEARLMALEKTAPRITQKRRDGLGFDEFASLMCASLMPLTAGQDFRLEAQSWLDAMTAVELDQLRTIVRSRIADLRRCQP
jgi:hypothetical protein